MFAGVISILLGVVAAPLYVPTSTAALCPLEETLVARLERAGFEVERQPAPGQTALALKDG